MEKHKNHKITHNIGGCLGAGILKFTYHRGPQKQSRPKGPNNLCSAAGTIDIENSIY